MALLQRTALFSGLALLAIITLVVAVVVAIRSRRRRNPAVVTALIMLGIIVLSIVMLFSAFSDYSGLAFDGVFDDGYIACYFRTPNTPSPCLPQVSVHQPTKFAAWTQLAQFNQTLHPPTLSP
jgi:hypothetical protein